MSGPVYLLSTLPHLDVSVLNTSADSAPVDIEHIYSVENFISLCEYTLSPSDTQRLCIAMRTPEESTLEFVLQALEYFSSVRDAIAQVRHGSRRSGSYTNTIVNDRIPVSADAHGIVETAVHAKNPLLREMEILKSLWAYLDEKEVIA